MQKVIHWLVSVEREKRTEREVLCALPKFWRKVLHCERAARLLTNEKLVFVALSPPRLGAERHRAAFGVKGDGWMKFLFLP